MVGSGIPPFEGDDLVREGSGWIVVQRSHESDIGTVFELVASNQILGLRCTAQELATPDGRKLLIEEDVRETELIGAPLPEPSSLVQSLLDSAGVETEQGDAAIPVVVLVGNLERHVSTLPLIQRRVRGMAAVIVRALDEAQQMVASDISLSDGAVLVSSPNTRPIVLPAMWVRGNSEAAARRAHRDVLGYRLSEIVPECLRQSLLDLHRAGRGIDEWAQEADRLDRELRSAQDELTYSLLVADEALTELDRVQRRVAFLEQKFREYGEILIEDDELEYPDEVNLSLDAMKYAEDLLPHLMFSPGAVDRCAELDEQHAAPITAKRAWRALRALNDYARAKVEMDWKGNLLQYCRETPAGFATFPPDDIALTESERTLGNPRCREARMFQVPPAVDPSGVVLMDGHVKIAGIGALAARLHFHDGTGGPTRRVHVGYLGPHLPLL